MPITKQQLIKNINGKYQINKHEKRKQSTTNNKIHRTLGWDWSYSTLGWSDWKTNDKSGKYGKDLMKIKFNSDDSLSWTLTSTEFFDIK